MKLYLVQHAEAKSDEVDPQRPLTEKGRADLKKTTDFIKQNVIIKVKNVYHSGNMRALQTAAILAEYIESPSGITESDGLKPLDNPGGWINRLGEKDGDIMLVGHLPHLSKLASLLLCQDENKQPVSFNMGGIVCLARADSGVWSVAWMVVPSILT